MWGNMKWFKFKFFWVCSFSNPEMGSAVLYNLIAMVGNNDQKSIKKIIKTPDFHETLNERYKNVHSYMVGKEASLLEGCSKSMRALAEAIRENKLGEKTEQFD